VERAVVVGRGRRLLPKDLPIFRSEYASSPPGRTLREVEIAHLRGILEETQWNVSKSADILGIDRSTLYDKIRRYELRKPA
jgi:transcriptional regulator of acetoin/glycerol metabolism